MTILISGGHLTPALALIDFIQKQHPQDKIVFAGRLYSQDKLKQLSQEKSEIEQRGIKFYSLQAPRLTDFLSLKVILSLLRLVQAIGVVGRIIDLEKPQVVLSFGGYLALPTALAAWIKKVPLITHEQTRVAGTTNRLIGSLAKKVGVAFSDAAEFFSPQKTEVIGMPLRLELFKMAQPPDWLPADTNLPILYVTGGNQGSLFINRLISQSLAELSSQFLIIHQCGNPIATHDYEQQLIQARNRLSPQQQANYLVKPWVNHSELAWIYQHAQVVISRAGANSVAELASYQLPAIFIPLPNSSRQEQSANAAWYQDHLPAQILKQNTLTKAEFVNSIKELVQLKRHQIDLRQVRDQQARVLADLYRLLTTEVRYKK